MASYLSMSTECQTWPSSPAICQLPPETFCNHLGEILQTSVVCEEVKVLEGASPGGSLKRSTLETDLCLVCGDRASGYHYNALSCEGCKGFFRRTVTRGAHYRCRYGDNCMMDMWMRRRCQACRMRRCKDVGMREECLLSERQRVARNVRRSSVKSRTSKTPCTAKPDVDQKPKYVMEEPGSLCMEQLSGEQRKLISHLVFCQDSFELPKPEDIEHVAKLRISSSFEIASSSDALFAHMVEMTILVTGLIVEFAKCLPGFMSLPKEDQVILLKGSASEVMLLRSARRYDPDSNTIIFGDGTPFTPDSLAFGGLQDYSKNIFTFAKSVNQMEVDDAEFALVTAVCIFSDRPGLSDLSAVHQIQEVYAESLQAYVALRHSNYAIFLGRLLMKLVDLRSLSDEHSRVLYRLTVERGSLPPLLQEYFDVPVSDVTS